MGAINLQELLDPIEGDSPAGEDLEYNPDFGELERAARPRVPQAVGDVQAATSEIDWRDVRDRALALCARSKDIRIAVYLIRALARTDGWTGVNDGLGLLHGYLEHFWDDVHPKIDGESGGNPTRRLNTLTWLCDDAETLRPLRMIPLVSLAGIGGFGIRDIEIAEGLVPPPEEGSAAADPAIIAGAFSDCDPEVLSGTSAAVAGAASRTVAIEELVSAKLGAGNGVNLAALTELLSAAEGWLKPHLERRQMPSGGGGETVAMAEAENPLPRGDAVGTIRSREDVVRVLENACEYFYRHEPSSPVPLLLRRAKRLVTMNFEEIVREIAPDAVSQVDAIRGAEDTGSGAQRNRQA